MEKRANVRLPKQCFTPSATRRLSAQTHSGLLRRHPLHEKGAFRAYVQPYICG